MKLSQLLIASAALFMAASVMAEPVSFLVSIDKEAFPGKTDVAAYAVVPTDVGMSKLSLGIFGIGHGIYSGSVEMEPGQYQVQINAIDAGLSAQENAKNVLCSMSTYTFTIPNTTTIVVTKDHADFTYGPC